MTISMYKTSVPIFVQFLTSMSAVLDKAAAHCEAKKIEPATLLNMRLYPNMFPLVRQLRAVTEHAISGTARLAGAELITFPCHRPDRRRYRRSRTCSIGQAARRI